MVTQAIGISLRNNDSAMLNEKGMIPKVKGGLSKPWDPLGVFHVSPPYLTAHLPFSHPTTTLMFLVGWGS